MAKKNLTDQLKEKEAELNAAEEACKKAEEAAEKARQDAKDAEANLHNNLRDERKHTQEEIEKVRRKAENDKKDLERRATEAKEAAVKAALKDAATKAEAEKVEAIKAALKAEAEKRPKPEPADGKKPPAKPVPAKRSWAIRAPWGVSAALLVVLFVVLLCLRQFGGKKTEEVAKQPVPTTTVEEKTETAEQPAQTSSVQDDKIAKLEAQVAELKKASAERQPAQKPAASVGQPTSEDTGAAEQPSKERMSGMPITGTSSVQTSADALAWFEELEKFKDKLSKYLEPSARVVIETKGMPVSIKELNIGEGAVDIQAAETKQEMAEGRARELKAQLDTVEAEKTDLEKELNEMRKKLVYAQDIKRRPSVWPNADQEAVNKFLMDWESKSVHFDELSEEVKKLRDELRLRNAPTSQGQQSANP